MPSKTIQQGSSEKLWLAERLDKVRSFTEAVLGLVMVMERDMQAVGDSLTSLSKVLRQFENIHQVLQNEKTVLTKLSAQFESQKALLSDVEKTIRQLP